MQQLELTESDLIFSGFLSQIQELSSRCEHPIKVNSIDNNSFQVWCSDAYVGQKVARLCMSLKGCKFGVKIVYGGNSRRYGKVYDFFPPGHFVKATTKHIMTDLIMTQRSRFYAEQRGLIQILSKDSTVSVHSADPGYVCLAIAPMAGLEAVLCKPIAELLGASPRDSHEIIGAAKVRVIEELLNDPSLTTAETYYEMWWEGQLWKKCITATRPRGVDGEIVLATQGVEEEKSWQHDYWHRFKRNGGG